MFFSLTFQSPLLLNIYNRCQDANLITPVYFMSGGKWHVAPYQTIDVDTVMQNRIEFYSRKGILEGALIYRIQRKHDESDGTTQDKSKCVQLLVVLYVDHTEGLNVRALLVEHSKKLAKYEQLKRLYQKYWHLLKAQVNFAGSNWLLYDATMLTTTVKAMNGDYRWDIFISEGENGIEKPLWINVER
jgi:hypothetical protein